MTTVLFVLHTSFLKIVQALSRVFVHCPKKTNRSLVSFYPNNYISFLQKIDEIFAIWRFLIESLVIQNDTTYELADLRLYWIIRFKKNVNTFEKMLFSNNFVEKLKNNRRISSWQ